MEELKFLEEQQVAPELIKRVEEFRSRYEVAPETAGRIVKPSIPLPDCSKGRTCYSPVQRQQEKISLQRTWHIFSTVPRTMFLFM